MTNSISIQKKLEKYSSLQGAQNSSSKYDYFTKLENYFFLY